MRLVDASSLAATLDHFEAVRFSGAVLANHDRRELATFIAGRFGQPRSYAGMPAPTERDYREGVRVFTGERVTSGAATGHIIGQEACRALFLLDVHTPEVLEPLGRATREMVLRLSDQDRRVGGPAGIYCCKACSVAVWRNLNACGLNLQDERARHGVSVLKKSRAAEGKWHGFPFYYTLLALLEMTIVEAQDEMEFAAPACAKLLARGATGAEPYASRRRELLERVVRRCGLELPAERAAKKRKLVHA